MGSGVVNRDLLSPERHTALRELARRFDWRLVVLFGSLARGGQGRDLDLAVLPAAETTLMEQGDWQARLEDLFSPWPVDLLLLHDALPLLTRFEIFRDGRCLFEVQAGVFSREQDRPGPCRRRRGSRFGALPPVSRVGAGRDRRLGLKGQGVLLAGSPR